MAGYFILGNAALQPVPAGTPLSDFELGSVVKILEAGTPAEFLVLQHGYPSLNNGATLLIRKDLYSESMWINGLQNTYATSTIDSYLNNEYLSVLDGKVQDNILESTIYYTIGNSNATVSTLTRKIFVLSYTEVGLSGDTGANTEGAALRYFNTNTARQCALNGVVKKWWTRSPYTSMSTTAWSVDVDGSSLLSGTGSALGLRPAFALPSDILVSDDGTITK